MTKQMGRPPKNMCLECRGWGRIYKQESLVTYFGDGDTKLTTSVEQPQEETCLPCNGTGYTGGRLRQGTPPVMEQWVPAADTQTQDAALAEIKAHVLDTNVADESTDKDLVI